jgi:hypothetical protein
MSEAESGPRGWKRLNFFKGLVTFYTDWLDREEYRVDKHRWHNRRLHGPGVVVGYGGDLAVSSRGDLSVEVQPGCAVDGEGRELVLVEPQIKRIPVETVPVLPATVYLVARYVDEPTDFIAYKQNLAVKGHRRILETVQIDVVQVPPEISREVELGRVLLDKGVRGINEAKTPSAPGPNELDTRFVLRVGRAGAGIDSPTQVAFTAMLESVRQSLRKLADATRLLTARDALAQAIAMSMMHTAGLGDARLLLELFASLFELQVAIYVDIKLQLPAFAAKPAFADWAAALRGLQALLRDRSPAKDRLVPCMAAQHRINEAARALVAPA